MILIKSHIVVVEKDLPKPALLQIGRQAPTTASSGQVARAKRLKNAYLQRRFDDTRYGGTSWPRRAAGGRGLHINCTNLSSWHIFTPPSVDTLRTVSLH